MNAPTHPGYYWARGHYTSAFGMNDWQLFVADFVAGTKKLVVRFADAIHPQDERDYPQGLWFKPSPRKWKLWQQVIPPPPPQPKPPKRKWTYAGKRRSWPKGSK